MFNALRAVAKFLNRCLKVSKKSKLALDVSETVLFTVHIGYFGENLSPINQLIDQPLSSLPC